MIKQLKISSNYVFLEGLSLRGSLLISNPNQDLAISYQFEPTFSQKTDGMENVDTNASMSSLISIFPKNGILLKGETQKITIGSKNRQQFDHQSFIDNEIKLQIKYSLDNNYNRIFLKNKGKYSLSPQKLTNFCGFFTIRVEVGTDHLRVKNQIENQVLFSSSLAKDSLNISKIGSKVKEADEDLNQVCTIVNSLDLNSKVKSSFNESPVKLKAQDSIAEENLFLIGHKSDEKIENFQTENKKVQKSNQQDSIELQSARQIQFSKSFVDFQDTIKKSFHLQGKVKTFELVIIAILAGFFYSLGANLSYLLKG